MSYEFILVDQDENGIVTVTINDPDAKNAVNWTMNAELVAEMERIENDPSARVMILTATGRIFCSGGNINRIISTGKVLEPPNPSVREVLFPSENDIKHVVTSLRQMSKPVIAAVNGPAVGSGVGLAVGCDIRIASTASRFGWVFVKRGIVPDDGSVFYMQQIIGYARAFEWGVTGRSLSAEQAHEIGFVNHVVEPEQLMAKAREIAMEIIENCPPLTVQAFKLTLGESLTQSVDEASRFTAHAQDFVGATEDHREAVRAYAERRKPVWVGR